MDAATFANISVALTTLLLAIVTVYYNSSNIAYIRKQLRIQQRQITTMLSGQEPRLLVKRFHFSNNRLNVSLLNVGEGIAYKIVVASDFYRVKLYISKEDQQKILNIVSIDHDDDIKDRFTPTENQTFSIESTVEGTNNNILVKFGGKRGLIQGYKKVYPKEGVALMISEDEGEAILKPGETEKIFNANPVFFVTNREERDFYGIGKIHQCFGFEGLRQFCQQNNTRYIAVHFSVYSKDAVQNTIFHQSLGEFIVDIEEDATLQEAYSKKRDLILKRSTFSPLDSDKMCMSLHLYTHLKQNNIIPAEIYDDEIAQ